MASPTVTNYLGTGVNPHLYLTLSDNQPNWGSYTIDYQKSGNIPYDTKNPTKKQWSTWNVHDQNNGEGNYYGTITLEATSTGATWVKYVGGEGYYLEGLHFTYKNNTYQLTVDKIVGAPSGESPFPNTPLATPAVYENTNTPVVLRVEGNRIVNDRGNTVILKGMVRPSLEWNPQGEYLSEKDILNMVKWGINTIRLDLNQNYWFQSGPVDEMGSYKQIINAIVYHAIEHDMAIILDLHWTENGHQSNMANKDSIRFWKEVAADYKDFGTVIFELFNEPVNIDKNVWLHGNSTYAGHQELYDAVRSTGAQNICLVNGIDWGYNLSFVNSSFHVTGENIAYGSHPYNRTSFGNNFDGVLGVYPLIFTEFGTNQLSNFPNGYQQYYQAVIDFIVAHDVSYTGFAWWVEASNPAFPALIKDWDGTPQYGGQMIHDDLKANPVNGVSE
nr:endo-beta-1,4-glucanase [uncultured bacterium]